MSCGNQLTITPADLAGLKEDIETVNDVVESTELTTTTKSGRVLDTLTGALTKLGYQPPVAYAASIVFDTSDGTKTIERSGIIYAPLPSALPFTTSGTWASDDEDKFFVVQSVTLYSGGVVINKPTVVDMAADASLQPGNVVHTEGYYAVRDGGATRYRVYAGGTFPEADGGTVITLSASGSQAARIPDSDKINVVQYGAVGDGVVDDTDAIQNAINAVAVLGGGELLFPSENGGVYRCNIRLLNGVSLRGINRAVTLKPATNSPVITLQSDTDVQRVAISELTIDGTDTQGTFTAQHGIFSEPDMGVEHSSVTVQDCLIKNCGAEGIYLRGKEPDEAVEHISLFLVSRCIIEGCTGPGIRAWGNVALLNVDKSDIKNNGDETTAADSNIVLQRSTSVLPAQTAITGCRIETGSYVSVGYALALLGVLDTRIENCRFDEIHTGFIVDDTPNGVITFDGNGFARSSGDIDAVGEITSVNGFIYRGNNVNADTTGPVGLDLPTDAADAKRLEISSTNSWGGLTASLTQYPQAVIAPADTTIDLPATAGNVPVNLTADGAATVDTLDDFNGGTQQFVHGDIIVLNITNVARTLTLDDSTGNLLLAGSANFTLNERADRIALQWDENLSAWVELYRVSRT